MTTGQLYCALYALTILLWLACRQTFKATRGAGGSPGPAGTTSTAANAATPTGTTTSRSR